MEGLAQRLAKLSGDTIPFKIVKTSGVRSNRGDKEIQSQICCFLLCCLYPCPSLRHSFPFPTFITRDISAT